MSKNTTLKEVRTISEFRLKMIDVFFAAFGAFVSGLFCIAQYFWGSLDFFIWIAAGFFFVTLLITYILSYSKKTSRNEHLLCFIQECANRAGPLNPIMLALSFLLAISSNVCILAVCISLEIAQLYAYFLSAKKVFPKIKFRFHIKVKTWIKSNKPLLITALFALISGVCWLLTADTLKLSDLCLNLLAGFISSGITIGVIDRIIHRQQESKDIPLKKALYRDVQLFTARLINFWEEMYVQSTADRSRITIEELFAPANVTKIGGNLDLEGFPNIIPKQNWFAYIESQRKDLVELGEKILRTYINIAEPELFQSIHYLLNDSAYIGHLRWINATRAVDRSNGIPRPTLLSWYTLMPQESDYLMVKQLFTWCRTQFKSLCKVEKEETVGVYPIADRITLINPNTAPTSIMSAEQKTKAFDTFKDWQDNSKNRAE